jgi:hypothetical protein
MEKTEFLTQIIGLPSEGRCYSKDNPLSKGEIEIKYMTAREEEILSSQNLIKKGVVLDKLFESIIVDKSINPDDIIIGDKNAIMLATRILGYGPEYDIEIQTQSGDTNKIKVDLGLIKTKEIDMDILNSDNVYKFTTPISKTVLEFKLLTHGDEKKIDEDIKAMRKYNKSDISSELTTRYRYMIKSVDGNTDVKSITSFINNRFLARDTKAFREYILSISPDIKMEFEYENPDTDEMEVRPVPMGVGFFWPST